MAIETGRTDADQTAPGERAQQAASSAMQDSKEVATEAAGQAASVTGTAVEQTRQVASEAGEQLRSLVSSTVDELRTQADGQADRIATYMQTFAGQLQALVDGRAEEAGPLPDYARQLSEKVQGVASSVREGGAHGALDKVTATARQRPGTFLLSAAALGFAAGRLMRGVQASSSTTSSPPSSSPSAARSWNPPPNRAPSTSTAPVDLAGIERAAQVIADPAYGEPVTSAPDAGQTPRPAPASPTTPPTRPQ